MYCIEIRTVTMETFCQWKKCKLKKKIARKFVKTLSRFLKISVCVKSFDYSEILRISKCPT